MPEETITLNQDHAYDLRELLDRVQLIEDWLLHTSDDVRNNLANIVFYQHFHPSSAAWWLIEDLGNLRCRLRKNLPPEDHTVATANIKPAAEAETRPTTSSRDGLDTATSIGNQRSPTPNVARALATAKQPGQAYVIIDGTRFRSTGWPMTGGATPASICRYRVNPQVIASP